MNKHEYERILTIFGERLKELMDSRGIKPKTVALAVGLSDESIRRYIKGKSGIELDNLVKLADYFGCSINFLVGKTDKVLDFNIHSTEEFPKRFRKVLKESGQSRYSLNKNTKFKDGYISNWDKGSLPNIFTLVELSEILNCTTDYLVGRER